MTTTGAQYDRTMDIKDVAKRVRRDLKAAYPGCKFSVRISRFAGGQSLTVTGKGTAGFPQFAELLPEGEEDRWGRNYQLLPAYKEMEEALQALVNNYNRRDVDLMTDYWNVKFYDHVDLAGVRRTQVETLLAARAEEVPDPEPEPMPQAPEPEPEPAPAPGMRSIKEVFVRSRKVELASEERERYRVAFTSPDEASVFARAMLAERDEEAFVVVLVDASNHPMAVQVVAQGGPDMCGVDPRSVFRSAILMGARGLILAHNHPSGSLKPSSADFELTTRLQKGGKLLNLEVLDHLILTEDAYTSMRAEYPGTWEKGC